MACRVIDNYFGIYKNFLFYLNVDSCKFEAKNDILLIFPTCSLDLIFIRNCIECKFMETSSAFIIEVNNMAANIYFNK